jgi:Ca2+/Na+ antiporter
MNKSKNFFNSEFFKLLFQTIGFAAGAMVTFITIVDNWQKYSWLMLICFALFFVINFFRLKNKRHIAQELWKIIRENKVVYIHLLGFTANHRFARKVLLPNINISADALFPIYLDDLGDSLSSDLHSALENRFWTEVDKNIDEKSKKYLEEIGGNTRVFDLLQKFKNKFGLAPLIVFDHFNRCQDRYEKENKEQKINSEFWQELESLIAKGDIHIIFISTLEQKPGNFPMNKLLTHVTYLLKKAVSILSPYKLSRSRDSIKPPNPFLLRCLNILKWLFYTVISLVLVYIVIAFIVEYILNKPPEIH